MVLSVAPAAFVAFDAAQRARAKSHLASTLAQLRQAFGTPLFAHAPGIDSVEQLDTQITRANAGFSKRQCVERTETKIVALAVTFVAENPTARELAVGLSRHLQQQIAAVREHHALARPRLSRSDGAHGQSMNGAAHGLVARVGELKVIEQWPWTQAIKHLKPVEIALQRAGDVGEDVGPRQLQLLCDCADVHDRR